MQSGRHPIRSGVPDGEAAEPLTGIRKKAMAAQVIAQRRLVLAGAAAHSSSFLRQRFYQGSNIIYFHLPALLSLTPHRSNSFRIFARGSYQ